MGVTVCCEGQKMHARLPPYLRGMHKKLQARGGKKELTGFLALVWARFGLVSVQEFGCLHDGPHRKSCRTAGIIEIHTADSHVKSCRVALQRHCFIISIKGLFGHACMEAEDVRGLAGVSRQD